MHLKTIEHLEVKTFTELGTGWEKRSFAAFAFDGQPLFCGSIDHCPPSTKRIKFKDGTVISWHQRYYKGHCVVFYRLTPESQLHFRRAKRVYAVERGLRPLTKSDRNTVLEMIADEMKLGKNAMENLLYLKDPELLNFLMQVDSAVLEKVLAVMNAGLPPTSTPTLKLVA